MTNQELFDIAFSIGRLDAQIDRLLQALPATPDPEQIAFERRVARTGLCTCRRCEKIRQETRCNECGEPEVCQDSLEMFKEPLCQTCFDLLYQKAVQA